LSKQELLGEFIEALMKNGWKLNGQTRTESYRTHSLAFGGGPILTTGGRQRLEKGGIKITIGLNTICIYRRPENPETLEGRGRLAGQRVPTFSDWYMTNISVSKRELADIPAMLQIIEKVAEKIKSKYSTKKT